MSGHEDERRRYRFPRRRRTGLFGALPPGLVTAGAVVLGSMWLGLVGWLPWPMLLPPIAVAVWVTVGRWHGRRVHEVIGPLLGWWWRRHRHRNRWVRPVPLITSTDGTRVEVLPEPLAGLELFEASVGWFVPGERVPVGVAWDRRSGLVTCAFRVTGDGQFEIADPATQEHRLDAWGASIATFAREGSPVSQIVWHDWTSPVSVTEQIDDLHDRWAGEELTPLRQDYLALIEAVSPAVVNHEVLVTISVDSARVATGRGTARTMAAIERLLGEAQALRTQLTEAALTVDAVLTAAELVTASRVRSDPSVVDRVGLLRRSLAARAGHSAPSFGPMLVDEHVDAVQVDDSWHRSWHVAGWPRRDVPAAWLNPLMTATGSTRSITMVFEPVTPSDSDAEVDAETSKREANIESRRRKGVRVRSVDEKALDAVANRELELTQGFAEMNFVGLVTMTAPTRKAIAASGSEMELTAARSGVELQPLLAQQAAGWVSSLPLGRNVAATRVRVPRASKLVAP